MQPPVLQLTKEHSLRRQNQSVQMRGLGKDFVFLTELNDGMKQFHSRGQTLTVSVEIQRPDIPTGTNACGYDGRQSKQL